MSIRSKVAGLLAFTGVYLTDVAPSLLMGTFFFFLSLIAIVNPPAFITLFVIGAVFTGAGISNIKKAMHAADDAEAAIRRNEEALKPYPQCSKLSILEAVSISFNKYSFLAALSDKIFRTFFKKSTENNHDLGNNGPKNGGTIGSMRTFGYSRKQKRPGIEMIELGSPRSSKSDKSVTSTSSPAIINDGDIPASPPTQSSPTLRRQGSR